MKNAFVGSRPRPGAALPHEIGLPTILKYIRRRGMDENAGSHRGGGGGSRLTWKSWPGFTEKIHLVAF
jgi:hypothetical protein